jgi:YidC/Oxa1 family membrane protein insertase
MKTLQPQIKKLQEQFKSDPKRLQVETFNLYKKNGMKFMGMEGCFPMLLQIPVFFAFYSTLRVAYELRGAPWILWIHDLGAYDPYYILPVLMGGGMFLQQKLTSIAADPAQARMMMMMPVVFTFMFLKLPAGLVLYWVVNSMTTIVVQKIIGLQNTNNPRPTT